MDSFMEHMRFLREHMNEHELRMGILISQKHEQWTIINALERDLQEVRKAAIELEQQLDHHSKKRNKIRSSIEQYEKRILSQENTSRGLAEALRGLKEEIEKRSILLEEKKTYFAETVTTTRSAVDAYMKENFPGNFQEDSVIPDTKCEDPGQLQSDLAQSDQEKVEEPQQIQRDSVQSEHEKDLVRLSEAENLLKELADQRRILEKTLQDIDTKSNEAETETKLLECKLRSLLAEKTEEEEYILSLRGRLSQLKEFFQTVTCGSCGQEYSVEYKDSEFIARENFARDYDQELDDPITEEAMELADEQQLDDENIEEARDTKVTHDVQSPVEEFDNPITQETSDPELTHDVHSPMDEFDDPVTEEAGNLELTHDVQEPDRGV